jgi:glycogen synthase
MKVLMLGWELPPHNSGGLGVACFQLCKKLSKKGVDVTFVLPYEGEHDFSFMKVVSAKIANASSITGVYDSALYKETNGLSGNVLDIHHAYATAIEDVVATESFDVIHAHDWLTFRAALRARELLLKPLILHVHSIESDRAAGGLGNPLVREIEQLGMLIADRVIAVSEHTRQKIINEYNIPPSKVLVAHNGIDLDEMQPLDADNSYKILERFKAQGYKVVVNVGRLTMQKGLTNLLLSAKMVIEKRPKTIFLIVGSGDQYRELIELGASLGISRNLVFTGFLRGKKWRDAFGVADLFVMPSVSEPFGLTPLEAIVYGTPSLISQQSGVAEVLKNCLKTDFWDSAKMADDIINVLRHDSLHDHLLENARYELQHLSWDRTAHILIDTYNHHHNEVIG